MKNKHTYKNLNKASTKIILSFMKFYIHMYIYILIYLSVLLYLYCNICTKILTLSKLQIIRQNCLKLKLGSAVLYTSFSPGFYIDKDIND